MGLTYAVQSDSFLVLPESLGLVDERPLFGLHQELPLGPKTFGDLRIVHLGILLKGERGKLGSASLR